MNAPSLGVQRKLYSQMIIESAHCHVPAPCLGKALPWELSASQGEQTGLGGIPRQKEC